MMPTMEYFEPSYHPQYQHDSMGHYEQQFLGQQSSVIAMPNPVRTNETKPRLGKDEVDILEREFNKNPKPSTQTKRGFAEDMGVDLARINNWFQNRRAKRKQEKKQEAYEANQAQDALAYSEPSSPDNYSNSLGYFSDNSSVQQQPTFLANGPPPAVAPYNPQYNDPATASMESLQRTLAAAPQEEFHEFVQHESPTFGGPLVHDFSNGDRAQFPPPDARFDNNSIYTFPSHFTPQFENLPHPMSDAHSSPEAAGSTPTPFNTYSSPPALEVTTSQSMTTFPSQLLPVQAHDDFNTASTNNTCSQSPEDSDGSAYDIGFAVAGSNGSLSSPPAPSIPFRSPPPMDIASRRKKVHSKPAALVADTLRGRPLMGPRTVSHAEGFRRPNDSPASSPMRRIHSAGGNRGGFPSRIQKSGVETAQRSPINLGGFADAGAFIEHNYHSFRNPPSLGGGSSLNSSLAPPTPMSPRNGEMTFAKHESGRSTASPVEGSLNFVFNASTGRFASVESDQNLQSPPETPQSQLLNQQNNWPGTIEMPEKPWHFEISDEAHYTPAQETFPMELHMPQPSMPHPSYLALSQPTTPAFGSFNPTFMFAHDSPPQYQNESPQYNIPIHSGPEYAFPETHYPPEMSPPIPKQKTFTFSHTTAADFSSEK